MEADCERGGRVVLENLQPRASQIGLVFDITALVGKSTRQAIRIGIIPKCVVSV